MATLIMSFVLAAVTAPSAPVQLLLAADTHEGKVASAGDGKLVIVDKNGDSEEFEVSPKAKITRNEKAADLEDIQEGDLVKVTVSRKGTTFVAVVIEANAPE
jgi:hypothetical protein